MPLPLTAMRIVVGSVRFTSDPCRRLYRGAPARCAGSGHCPRWCSGRDVRFIARPPPRSVRAAFPHTAPTSGV